MIGVWKFVVEVILVKDFMFKDGYGLLNVYCVVCVLFFGLVGVCEIFIGLEKGN